MKKAFIYLYDKLDKSNSGAGPGVASIQLCLIAVMHIMSLVWLCDAIFNVHIFDSYIRLVTNEDATVRKLLLIPLSVLPLYILIYLPVRLNMKTITEGRKEIEQLSNKEKFRKNIFLAIYIAGSFLFWVAALVAPSWVPMLK